jgi:cytochrome bd ubiquinol oxidase subunit II
MHLYDVPLILMLVGLTAYAVLGGADFGAGAWQLLAGRGEHARRIRDHAHHSIGPVWETNHVWLIFVLVVCWTAYPRAFGSIMSTLAAPLFIAGLGIILRGTAYAMRSGTATAREQRAVETLFGVSSILTPFALGAAIGGIASGRVPVGNAEGDLMTSWLNPTSILIGTLAVVTAAYTAAVFLAADAVRRREPGLAQAFRVRALGAALAAGAVAIGGLFVLRSDAEPLWDGLTSGWGLAAVIASALAGAATIALVWRGRFEPARYTASLAVASIVAGWALAQSPTFLPGLTVEEAAADRSVLIATLVGIVIGVLVLAPSLALLFGLVLKGRFDAAPTPPPDVAPRPLAPAAQTRLLAVSAGGLGTGVLFLTLLEPGWAHAIGVAGLFTFIAAGFVAIASSEPAWGLNETSRPRRRSASTLRPPDAPR